ncbi:MAG: PhzF family phenazine biosynthesis protein [Solirubrobacteraceae bacterium]
MSDAPDIKFPLSVELDGDATHPYVVVDVFTQTPLEGNQLAVFTDGRAFESAEMQSVARELNLAETVFVLPAVGDGDLRVRIFTPRIELPFAGHPVLGTAFVVASALGRDTVTLETDSGLVTVEVDRSDRGMGFGRFTRSAPASEPFESADELLSALGVQRSLLPVEGYLNGPRHVYVALPDEEAVAAVNPNFGALAKLPVGVNCFAGQGRCWTTRMFGVAIGVPEDAATGSAAGPLAVHLARHGQIAVEELIEIHQGASIGRPSTLFARVNGTAGSITTVEVAGSAVLVATGQYRVR